MAISFLADDTATAAALGNRLQGLKVFFFPDKQEELAGTEGLESMREPFLKARVVVVLFRERWGQTRWTKVEERAIKDRSFEAGWESLVFVQLDKEP